MIPTDSPFDFPFVIPDWAPRETHDMVARSAFVNRQEARRRAVLAGLDDLAARADERSRRR